MKNKVKLGDKVVNSIDGLEGIALSRTEYLNGCVQIEIIKEVDDEGNLPEETYHIDDVQLTVIAKGDDFDGIIVDKSENKIRLGDEVQDRITKFRGIAVARTYHISGLRDIEIEPKVDKKGIPRENVHISELLLERVGPGINKKPKKKQQKKQREEGPSGGQRRHPPSSYHR